MVRFGAKKVEFSPPFLFDIYPKTIYSDIGASQTSIKRYFDTFI